MSEQSTSEDALPWSISNEDLETLSKLGTPRHYASQETVFSTGDTGDEMYLVLSGAVDVVLDGGARTKRLGKGEIFGELAFIMGEHRRTATVRAAEQTTLALIAVATIKQLTRGHATLLVSILRHTCRYLIQSERALVDDLKAKNVVLQNTLDYLRATKEELDYQELLVQTDQLTGLYNRRCFDDQMVKFIERLESPRQGASIKHSTHVAQSGHTLINLGLLILDLDGFKPINDTFGHPFGDEVLKQVGGILRQTSRNTDLPCRLGGDEFALLLADLKPSEGAAIGERIRAEIHALQPVAPDSPLRVSGSIGGTLYHGGEGVADFLKRADQYLYKAKKAGRDRVVWVD